MANEAGACQTRNVKDYDDEEEEKEIPPLDEVSFRGAYLHIFYHHHNHHLLLS